MPQLKLLSLKSGTQWDEILQFLHCLDPKCQKILSDKQYGSTSQCTWMEQKVKLLIGQRSPAKKNSLVFLESPTPKSLITERLKHTHKLTLTDRNSSIQRVTLFHTATYCLSKNQQGLDVAQFEHMPSMNEALDLISTT